MSRQLFLFPFLFSRYFCFDDGCVVGIVSACWNQISSALVMLSSNCSIDDILNAGEYFFFFSWHIQSKYVMYGMYGLMHRRESSFFLVHLLTFFSRSLWERAKLTYECDNPGVYHFDEIFAIYIYIYIWHIYINIYIIINNTKYIIIKYIIIWYIIY